MKFSKDQFIEWTTKGFPIEFNGKITKEYFLESLSEYVNFNDNDYYSEYDDEDVYIFKNSVNLATVKYDNMSKRLVILTIINDDDEITKDSDIFLSQQKDLGEICLGIITFCQCMEEHVLCNTLSVKNSIEPWPLKS